MIRLYWCFEGAALCIVTAVTAEVGLRLRRMRRERIAKYLPDPSKGHPHD